MIFFLSFTILCILMQNLMFFCMKQARNHASFSIVSGLMRYIHIEFFSFKLVIYKIYIKA